jgi:hypothetical protein
LERRIAGFVISLVLCLASRAAPQEVVTTATLFRNLYNLESLPLAKDERCRQFSSYDRSGGNDDAANYLAWDRDASGKGKALLAEMQGPGAIVRIWSAHPDGTLKIYLDGQGEPTINMPFDQFFKDPALHPIRTTSSGGWISYWPIPYAKSCKVVVEDTPGFHYHVTYQTYRSGTNVETYTQDLTPAARSELESALKVWQDPARAYSPASESLLGTSPQAKQVAPSVTVGQGGKETIFSGRGPACIDSLRLRFPGKMTPLALKRLVLRAYWDGEKSPSIESPVLDFFGCGFQESPFVSLPLIMQPGDYTCRFPMPFAKSGRIELVNGGDAPASVEVNVDYRTFEKLNPRALYFHAKWYRELTVEGVPYTILKAKGQGHYVGCNMSMQGQRWISFLEGDELIYVDGEKEPSIHGTGTEDYFNCGWYFATGLVAQPLHGHTYRTDRDQIAAYRLQVPDCVPFDKQIEVRIEHGGENDYPDADYSSTAYFYQKEPHHDFFKLPEPSHIYLPRRPWVPVSNSTEAEKLSPKACGGVLRMVKWEDITGDWCGTGVPTLDPKTDGASVTFKLPVPIRDNYQITALLARGRDYGKVCCIVDGGPAGAPVDMYADAETVPAGPVLLQTAVLDPGMHEVALAVAGKKADGKLPKISVDKFVLVSNSAWIRDWQVIGPFPLRGVDDPDPCETDGFIAGKMYDGSDGKVTWQPLKADRNGLLRIGEFLNPKQHSRVYASAKIISPDDRQTELMMAASDGMKAYVNGKEVFRIGGFRPPEPDQHRVMVRLHKGENTLLMKVLAFANAGMYARVRDPMDELRYGTGQ